MASPAQPVTVPTYTHRFYERLYAHNRCAGRFADVPAFRDFVGYQVRLLNAVMARVRGLGASDPMTIARLNARLLAEDLDDLCEVIAELVEHQLMAQGVADRCIEHLQLVKLTIFPAAAPSAS